MEYQYPYTHVPATPGLGLDPCWLWFWPWRRILFEDTPVLVVRAGDAERLTQLLNAAYNLGFSSGYVAGQVATKPAFGGRG